MASTMEEALLEAVAKGAAVTTEADTVKEAVLPAIPACPVKKLFGVTHHWADLDELLLFYLKQVVEEAIGNKVRWEFCFTGRNEMGDVGADIFAAKERGCEVVEAGVGDGPDNEHPTADHPRIAGKSAVLIFAERHGLDQDPCLGPIIREVTADDLGAGDRSAISFRSMLEGFYLEAGYDHAKLVEVTKLGIRCLQRLHVRRYKLIAEAKVEFDRVARIKEFPGFRGEEIRLVVIETDTRQFPMVGNYAMMRPRYHGGYGGNCNVVILKDTVRGHASVLSYMVDLTTVARSWRLVEQRRRKDMRETNWTALRSEGVIGAPNIYFLPRHRVMNGGRKYPNEDPTSLTAEELERLVEFGLGAVFPLQSCYEGHCIGAECLYHQNAHVRCGEIRYNERFPGE